MWLYMYKEELAGREGGSREGEEWEGGDLDRVRYIVHAK